jgi:DNA-binding NarL/FixJ family response regulator
MLFKEAYGMTGKETKRMAPQLEALALDASNQEYAVQSRPAQDYIQRIILVDAHTLVRSALQRAVSALLHVEVIASCSTIQDVFTVADNTTILLLGTSVSVTESLKLVGLLREQHLTCGVVLIQQELHPETARTLIAQGIHCLLDKNASEKDLAFAITAASLGNTFLNHCVRDMVRVAISRAAAHLTEREMQVLSHLKYGESNFRIAHEMGLKEKTIEKYLTSIYDKLNVRSRTEAVLCLQKLHI